MARSDRELTGAERGGEGERQRHIVGGALSRRRKAQKIERILAKHRPVDGVRLLDIGAGTGEIAGYFAEIGCEVSVADIENSLAPGLDLDFHRIECGRLPFADGTFDVVLFNHVIEHVGPRPAQLAYLREIKRVLAPDGALYVAVPNKWTLLEPHYKIPFLSWLPQPIADFLVRLSGHHHWYDCAPLHRRALRALLEDAGYRTADETRAAIAIFLELEGRGGPVTAALRAVPDVVWRTLMPVIPTLTMVARPLGGSGLVQRNFRPRNAESSPVPPPARPAQPTRPRLRSQAGS